jgi:hypothetical protein
MVPVPVSAPYLDHKKQISHKKFWKFLWLLHSKLFYKEKVHKFQQIYGKMWMKKMFNEGNQKHNFMSSSGSGTVINYGSGSDFLTSYGSGSTSQKVTVPTVPVPVPQHWLQSSCSYLGKLEPIRLRYLSCGLATQQCCGSGSGSTGSTYFWASWIRIRIH